MRRTGRNLGIAGLESGDACVGKTKNKNSLLFFEKLNFTGLIVYDIRT
jgi:hypothetical protein